MPWVPAHPDDFPSLGWGLLDWWAEYLPSPRDPAAPLIFTDEQARQIIEWYRLDPATGRRIYRRGYSRRSKGWGKSPVEAAKCIGELAGPVRFDGWGADGQPVARPWGYALDPRPWVQVGAISEDQTDNTWSVVHYLLTENDGRAADNLGIDAGLTRCFLRGQPGAKMEPVTSAAGSREGQPITYAVLDESHLMTPSNGGVKLAETMRRNAAKMGGTSYETTNSYVTGKGTVAEASHKAVMLGARDIFADQVEAPREISGVPVDENAPDEVLTAALAVAYGDSWWVDVKRLVADIRDPATKWDDACKFFLNWPRQDHESWGVIPRELWAACGGSSAEADKGFAAFAVAEGQQRAALAWSGQRVADARLEVQVVKLEAGTAWLVESCKNAERDTGRPIYYKPRSPSDGVVDMLTAAGVRVQALKAGEYPAGCAALQNDVTRGGVVHLNAGNLNDAVRDAGIRSSGGGFEWSPRHSTGEIIALEAVTVACIPARQPTVFFVY